MGILNLQAAADSSGSVQGLVVNPANNRILSRGNVIGVCQSFNPSESVSVSPVMGLGVEGVVTSARSNYSGGTFSTPVVQIYDNAPLEAFGIIDKGGGVGGLRQLSRLKSLYQQREPLDIQSVTYTPQQGEEMIETFRNCWITSYGKTYSVSSATVAVNVSWKYEKVV